MKTANSNLREEVGTLANELSGLKAQIECQASEAISRERNLQAKNADLLSQVSSLSEQLKVCTYLPDRF